MYTGKRRIAGAVCVPLLALLGVAAPAAHAATLTLSPSSGPPGAKVTATASGFTAEEPLTFRAGGRDVGDDAASASGGGSVTFRVSKKPEVDVVTVIVRGEGSHKAARAQFAFRTAWNQFGRGPAHNNANLIETGLGPVEAVDIERLWQSASGPSFDRSSPIKPGGGTLVYAARLNGAIGAFSALTGVAQAWPAPPGALTSLSTPAFSNSRLFVGDQQGHVRALNTSTPGTIWTGNTNGAVSGPITVDGSTVYAGSEDGKVYAFPMTCASTCLPTWVGNVGSPVRGGVAVAYGRVYALGADRMLRSYLVGCATGGASCIPIDTSPLLPGVVAPETTPVISGGRVFAMSTGNVSSFDAECLACGAHWSSSGGAPGARGGLVVAGGMVYAQRGERLAAYPVVCGEGGATCAPTWSATLPLNGPPTEGGLAYADGMVWASFSRRISGIVARCGTGGATCTPLVSIPTHAVSETTPLVVDGRIYIGTDDTMSAYGIPDN